MPHSTHCPATHGAMDRGKGDCDKVYLLSVQPGICIAWHDIQPDQVQNCIAWHDIQPDQVQNCIAWHDIQPDQVQNCIAWLLIAQFTGARGRVIAFG